MSYLQAANWESNEHWEKQHTFLYPYFVNKLNKKKDFFLKIPCKILILKTELCEYFCCFL